VPIEDAQEFKEKSQERGSFHRFVWKADEYNWYFDGNDLFPTKIVDKDNKYIIELPLENPTEITFNFDDLGIENLYLKGFVFNYPIMAKEYDKEQEEQEQKKQEEQRANFEEKRDSIYYRYANQERYAKFLPNKAIFDEECEGLGLNAMIKYAKGLMDQMEKEWREAYEKEKNDFCSEYIIPDIPQIYYSHYKDDYGRIGKEAMLDKVLNAVKEIVNRDAYMNREWTKNGHYFEDIWEFFKAYKTSSNYRNILKEKKPTK